MNDETKSGQNTVAHAIFACKSQEKSDLMLVANPVSMKTQMNNNDPGNPYEAPAAAVYSATSHRERELVSGWRRLATYLVDVVCFYIAIFVVSLILIFAIGNSWVEFMQGIGGNLISIVIYIAYYIGFEALFARTPGKFVTGTVVVNEEGKPPSFGQVLGRSFSRLIPFESFSCIGEQSRGWHDSIAHTYVVRVN